MPPQKKFAANAKSKVQTKFNKYNFSQQMFS